MHTSINAAFYGFFPNLPCLSLFFLNLPCCISFFFSFPCGGVPLLAVVFPPSNFLFLSLLEVKTLLKLCRTVKAAAFNSNAPLDADDSCAPRFLQHRLPFLIISTNFVPTNMILISTVIQKPTFSRPHTHSSMSISLTFSTSCLCLSSNSLAASFYNKQMFQVKVWQNRTNDYFGSINIPDPH